MESAPQSRRGWIARMRGALGRMLAALVIVAAGVGLGLGLMDVYTLPPAVTSAIDPWGALITVLVFVLIAGGLIVVTWELISLVRDAAGLVPWRLQFSWPVRIVRGRSQGTGEPDDLGAIASEIGRSPNVASTNGPYHLWAQCDGASVSLHALYSGSRHGHLHAHVQEIRHVRFEIAEGWCAVWSDGGHGQRPVDSGHEVEWTIGTAEITPATLLFHLNSPNGRVTVEPRDMPITPSASLSILYVMIRVWCGRVWEDYVLGIEAASRTPTLRLHVLILQPARLIAGEAEVVPQQAPAALAPAPTALLQGSAARHTGPSIPVRAYDVSVQLQSPNIFLAIANGDLGHVYHAQVLDFAGAREPLATPWTIPWRDGGPGERNLAPGETQLLAIATGDGMGNVTKTPRPRELHFALFHLRQLEGAPILAEPLKANLGDFARQDHLFEMRIRIYCDDQPSDFRCRLGFLNENDAAGNLRVNGTITDWSEWSEG